MNGTALYECAAAIFIAQAYGYELTFAMQFSIVSIALLTSIGVAGVPSAPLVAIAIILGAVGLPLEVVVSGVGDEILFGGEESGENILVLLDDVTAIGYFSCGLVGDSREARRLATPRFWFANQG